MSTPETDQMASMRRTHQEWQAHGERLERERDELRRWTSVNGVTELERERDELREALNDWENAAKHVESDHPDEVHCGCVPILRKLLESSKRARASLSEACDHLQRERDALHAAIRNLREVQGRHHTHLATERLFGLLMGSSQPKA